MDNTEPTKIEVATDVPKKRVTKRVVGAATLKTPKAPRAKITRKKKNDEIGLAIEPVTVVADAGSTDTVVPAETRVDVPIMDGGSVTGLGRRKTAIARVRVTSGGKGIVTVNGIEMDKYFTTFEQRLSVINPLKTSGVEGAVNVEARVIGGGHHSQAEAVRLGISRAIIKWNPVFRKTLKKLGFLTRDPRSKERKKPGLKRARRAPQWSKR